MKRKCGSLELAQAKLFVEEGKEAGLESEVAQRGANTLVVNANVWLLRALARVRKFFI